MELLGTFTKSDSQQRSKKQAHNVEMYERQQGVVTGRPENSKLRFASGRF